MKVKQSALFSISWFSHSDILTFLRNIISNLLNAITFLDNRISCVMIILQVPERFVFEITVS